MLYFYCCGVLCCADLTAELASTTRTKDPRIKDGNQFNIIFPRYFGLPPSTDSTAYLIYCGLIFSLRFMRFCLKSPAQYPFFIYFRAWAIFIFVVIYQTQETVFRRDIQTPGREFDEIPGVWIADKALSRVFDISSQSKQKLRSERRSEIVKIYAN